VCLCGPKSCFFSPLSLPFFCVLTSSSTSSSTSADLIQKNKKKKERSLSSLSLALPHEKALFTTSPRRFFSPLREFFFSYRIVESKKSGKNPKPSRGTFSPNARTRARRKRERKKDDRFRTNRTFFFFAVRFVFVFRVREKERKKLCAKGLRERERATVRYLTHSVEREIKKK
jgi:hypothetical protein